MFIFTLLCSASIGFMKALKAFIKPFEAPQRNVKIISIRLSEMHRMLKVKLSHISFRNSHTPGYDLQVMKNDCSIWAKNLNVKNTMQRKIEQQLLQCM